MASTLAVPSPAADSASRSETFAIEGMHCASCVARVENAIKAVPGTLEAAVNLATETGTVRFDPHAVDIDQIARAITQAGYPASIVHDPALREAEHLAQRQREEAVLQRKVIVAGIAAVLIALIAHLELFGIRLLSHTASGWVQLILVLPVQFWAGAEFYTGSWAALRQRTADMNVLIMVGTSAAFLYSILALWFPALMQPMSEGHHHPPYYFESAAVIIALILLGRLLELRAKTQTTAAIRALMTLQADTALRIEGATDVTVPVEALAVGDQLRVLPGARVPVDGRILAGQSDLDESLLTGEPMPVPRGPGDPVIGGAINTTGAFVMEATQVGAGTMLARIIRLVQSAQGSKAPIQRLADQIAAVFVPIVLIVALWTAVLWMAYGGALLPAAAVATTVFTATIAVLIIACPCALGLATPTAIMVGTGRGARAGILVKNGAALEQLQRIDTVVFDKTGTLTAGQPTLAVYTPAPGAPEHLASWIAQAEKQSEHPLARAVVAGFAAQGIAPAGVISDWTSVTGAGIRATIEGHQLLLGTAALLAEEGIDSPPPELPPEVTPVLVALDGQRVATLGLADALKPSTPAVIAALHARGLRTLMLTGDHPTTAATIAKAAGITEFRAQVLPSAKAQVVAELQQEGRRVAMLGDGINDAPALAQADVGIAMGSGTDVAMETADVTLLRGELPGFLAALDLSRATFAVIRQNLFWAFAYNVVGIPLAAGLYHVLFGWPFLNPMFAAAAMAASSVTVLTNSLRLRGWHAAALAEEVVDG